MKALATFIIAFCSSLYARSQGTITYPFLGHPVSQFKDSLLCKDALHLDKTYDEYTACPSFLVTPSSAVYRYGRLEFSSVFIFPNKEGIINEISHHKTYVKDGPGPTSDVSDLTTYLNSIYGTPTIKKVKTQYAEDKYITWEKDRIRMKLLITKVLKKKNINVKYILSLHLEKI